MASFPQRRFCGHRLLSIPPVGNALAAFDYFTDTKAAKGGHIGVLETPIRLPHAMEDEAMGKPKGSKLPPPTRSPVKAPSQPGPTVKVGLPPGKPAPKPA